MAQPIYFGERYNELPSTDDKQRDVGYWRLFRPATKAVDVCPQDPDEYIALRKDEYGPPLPIPPGCDHVITRIKFEPFIPTHAGISLLELAAKLGIYEERVNLANTLGLGEKWLAIKSCQRLDERPWYFVTPLGLLYTGTIRDDEETMGCYVGEKGALVAIVGRAAYDDPSLLFSARCISN